MATEAPESEQEEDMDWTADLVAALPDEVQAKVSALADRHGVAIEDWVVAAVEAAVIDWERRWQQPADALGPLPYKPIVGTLQIGAPRDFGFHQPSQR